MDYLPKRYDAGNVEPKWQQYWEEKGVYRFQSGKDRPVYSIDTPPPIRALMTHGMVTGKEHFLRY